MNNVPYFSQWADTMDEYWKSRTCTLACLASIISSKHPEQEASLRPLDALVEEALALNARDPNVGWIHEHIITLAKQHDVELARREYKTGDIATNLQQGFSDIDTALKNGGFVILSVKRGWKDDGTPHSVLVVGKEGEEYVLYEPDAQSKEDGGIIRLTKEALAPYWRRLAMFAE
jgi:hypothetical protein